MRRFGLPQLAMLAPAQLLLILAIALPSVYVLYLSFTVSTYGSDPQFVGWQNYIDIWNDVYFWRAFWNTAVVINLVIYIELALAMGLAVVFASGVPFRRVMMAIVLMPYAISEVVAVIIWKFMMDPSSGLVERTIQAVGLPAVNWSINPVAGLGLVCVISIWLHLPFTFVLIYAALKALPEEPFEAARVDGASGWQTFRLITLPGIMPTVLIALIFRYILEFRLFSEVWLLTAGGPARMTEVMAIYLYKQAFTYSEFGKGAAMGWVMVLSSAVVALVLVAILHRRSFATDD